MRTIAAVLVEPGRPLELADLEIPPLRPGQALVEVAWSGVCQTQLLECRGLRGVDRFLPHCLGHEGSGIVLETGPEVTRCTAGDRVLLSWMKAGGADVAGTVYRWGERAVNAGGVTTFGRHAVVSENRVTRLPGRLPLREAAYFGCALPTGLGAAWNTGRLRRGENIAVLGTGGVGLFAVAAAALSEAARIVAVDVNESRLSAAQRLGATDCLNAAECDPVEAIRQLCPHGVDVAIEASGRPSVMQQALRIVRPRGGRAVLVGNAAYGSELVLDPAEFNQGKQLLGSWGGDNDPDRDFPKYFALHETGKLSLAPLTAEPYALSAVNDALEDLAAGRVIRPLLDLSKC